MKYTVTAKGFALGEKDLATIERNVTKLSRLLVHFKDDLPLLTILIKKDKERSTTPKNITPEYYEGTITLRLPKKPLIGHILGNSADEGLRVGFQRVIKELETYKGKHFKNDSEYYNHESIRKPS